MPKLECAWCLDTALALTDLDSLATGIVAKQVSVVPIAILILKSTQAAGTSRLE